MKHWILGAAVATGLAVSTTSAFAEKVIRVTLQLPETHSLGQNWMDFARIVEEKSGGELKIQLFPSAQLFKDQDVPNAVGTGAVEAGSAFIGRFAGSVPAVDVIAIPFVFENEKHLRASVAPGSELRKEIDGAIVKETNAKVLWWQAFGRNIYLNNGSAIRTPADIKGKKVRTYGKVHGWTVEALGGAPTLMSGSKQFLGYQQGAVDVGMTGASAVKSRKLFEVMDHMTLTFDSAIEFVAVMNQDFYNDLSDAEKAIIDDAALEVEAKLRDEIYTEEAEIVDEMKSVMTVVDLSDAERAEWVAATEGVVTRFVEETGETGAASIDAIKAAK
ncbi:TRAP transporter substrate-binding protein DctP [Kiloniella laminariae]|uniref:TRAP transporter substrate-binding protein DctP n=1 Tax=Kiloniella laminariae TaxID=454162 RepID=A0ABT4LHC6_9PROT|nr:TRAP transporter substrate-binding protein DctP [Kiloniella laminariae]MCZ4279751.1 TRAP transporter substrate-binding protein DctP [Kiloniella laminariae]